MSVVVADSTESIPYLVGLPNDGELHSCVYLNAASNYAWKDTSDCTQSFAYLCEFCEFPTMLFFQP